MQLDKNNLKNAGHNWVLLHEHGPSKWTLLMKHYLAKNNVNTLEDLPCPPDLPSPIDLFPQLKMVFKGHHFADMSDCVEIAMKGLLNFWQTALRSQQVYEQWKNCWMQEENISKKKCYIYFQYIFSEQFWEPFDPIYMDFNIIVCYP